MSHHHTHTNYERNLPVTSANPDKDKFLFYFEPNNLARDCCCGCSLKFTVQIISLIYLAASLSSLFTAIRMHSFVDILISLAAFTVNFVAAVCVIYSVVRYKFLYAHSAYFIYAVLFLITLADNLIILIFIFAGYYYPLPSETIMTNGIIFLIAILIVRSIDLYFLWVIFSYAIHLKHNRLPLIRGEYDYKYLDDEVVAEPRNIQGTN
jgi:hypothetical protein